MPSPLFDGPFPSLPHQAPFRLIDRIVAADVTAGYLLAERRLTCNDALWPAESHAVPHFISARSGSAAAQGPGSAFPPTLIIEALCQAAACLNALTPPPSPSPEGAPRAQHHGYLVAISDVKFPTFAYVGETIALAVQQKEKLGAVIAFFVQASVADPAAPTQPRQVASGRLLFAVRWA